MRFHVALGAAAAALIPLTVMAQTPPPAPAPAPETAPQKSWKDLITVDGLADAYGSFRAGGTATVPATLRVFDAPTDTFALAFAKLGVGIKAEPVGMRLDLGFGPVGDIVGVAHVMQAYASFAVATSKPLTIDVGRFVTAAGAEVIEAHSNWNYSRSLLFNYAIPLTHTGIRLTTPLTSAVTLQAMVVNGWDNLIDNNAGKTLGVSLTYAMASTTTIIVNGMAGPETTGGLGNNWRYLLDVVASHATGPLSLNLNFDYGHEGAADWFGLAAYVRMAINQMANLSVRGELFADRLGARLGLMGPAGGRVTVGEVTGTVGFPVGNNAELRVEGRFDAAGKAIFAFEPANMDLKKFQLTLTGAALVWF